MNIPTQADFSAWLARQTVVGNPYQGVRWTPIEVFLEEWSWGNGYLYRDSGSCVTGGGFWRGTEPAELPPLPWTDAVMDALRVISDRHENPEAIPFNTTPCRLSAPEVAEVLRGLTAA